MYKILAAHQPNFFPTLGYFDKMRQCDIFAIRDETLFSRSQYHNRNRIRIPGNDENPMFRWIGVPVENHIGDYLKYVKIKDANRGKRHWKDQLLHEISVSYSTAPYFADFFPEIKKIVMELGSSLVHFNMKIIKFLRGIFNIQTPLVMASDLGLKPEHYQKSDASQDLVDICKRLNAETYLSGAGGRDYLDLMVFEKAGIPVKFQNFIHPIYNQNYKGFLPHMSAIDALFSVGRFPANAYEIQSIST